MAASRRAVLSVALVIRFTEKVNLGSKGVSVNGCLMICMSNSNEINRDRKGFRPSLRPHQKEGQCSRFLVREDEGDK